MNESIEALRQAAWCCPPCPHCGGRVGLPLEFADWSHRADKHKGHRLACPACGGGWVGTDDEVKAAWDAQFAWSLKDVAEAIFVALAFERAAPELAVIE